MRVGELYAELEKRIPRALSCDWDNDGLMCCPDPGAEVRRVLVALDVTGNTVRRAIDGGYDLIVSHHPMIFRPLRALESGNYVAKRAIDLARAGVSVMSFHTRLDAVEGGVNDTLANLLGLRDVTPFGDGIGRVGILDYAYTLCEFAEKVKSATGAPAVLCADAGRAVRRVALLGGSGSDDVPEAIAAGADTYLTGELAYHWLADAREAGINLLAAGHFHTENPVCVTLRGMLTEIEPTLTVDLFDSNRAELISGS